MCSSGYLKGLLIVSIGCCLGYSKAYSQTKAIPQSLYLASTIPDSLKEDANAVVRYSFSEKTIKAPGKTLFTHHSLVTILNEKGDHEAMLTLGYDKKFNRVDDVQMLVYDANGKLLKKYNKNDMYDRSAMDDETLATDYRVLMLGHTVSGYPTTIEVIYEQTTNSYLDLGTWHIESPETSVQNEEYKISVNPAVGFRYKSSNTNIAPQKTKEGVYDVYYWKVSNLKAIKPEEEAPAWRVFPKVSFAANQFEFDGLPGDISTWQAYGKWYQALNADVCNLSPQRAEEIKKLTVHLPDDKAKTKYLYDYLQKNMHYVSIQLGIGGLKPFPAMFVDQKKYGDCKALSNYMVAMLKAVNIPAYYALVQARANEEPADPSFPADPFNHVIVCVPLKGDTTWLECTNSTNPFGKLGSFTENRNALLITENGGKLVNTPKSTPNDNQFNSEVHIVLDADGGAKAQMKIISTGEYRDTYVGLSSIKTDKQKEFLINYLHIKQPSLFQFNDDAPDKDGVKEFTANLEYDKFCDVMSGDKRFYRPQVFDLWGMTVPILEKRKSDFYFEHPMQKTCVTTIDLPAGFEAETIPVNISLKFTYGNYDVIYNYNKEKNQVISTAKFILNNQVIPAAKYTEMQQYMDGIAKAQNKKLVIRRKA